MLSFIIILCIIKLYSDIFKCDHQRISTTYINKLKMASQVSLPATPQANTSYDSYMQSLQQKLSSISMQNSATLGPLSSLTTFIPAEKIVIPSFESTVQNICQLQVDSSAPSSGTATTEMLSPVREFDSVLFPSSPPPSTTETPKHIYKNLNNELSKINARKESTVTTPFDVKESEINEPENEELHIEETTTEPELTKLEESPQKSPEKTLNEAKIPAPDDKIRVRRVSRFKVSVVTEPDPTKLIIQPDPKPLNQQQDVSCPVPAETDTSETEIIKNDPEAVAEVATASDGLNSTDNLEISCFDLTKQNTTKEEMDNGLDLKMEESLLLINNTMQQLQENVQASYLTQARTITANVSSWSTQTNETFEDMLSRQQAELNALIEAHRKQQIEYMKSITEISKTSSNNKNE